MSAHVRRYAIALVVAVLMIAADASQKQSDLPQHGFRVKRREHIKNQERFLFFSLCSPCSLRLNHLSRELQHADGFACPRAFHGDLPDSVD